jgi:pimeloyl-ACP methyl ester carboxylesterase
MKERVVVLRTDPALIGIMTEPEPGARTRDCPAFVILNAGVVHRVGPNRFHVRLSRALAAVGFTVLRFDLSGLGDSESRGDAMSFEQSSPLETQQAMDHLAQATGAERFVLAGICSGAATAFRSAVLDSRVVGAVLIDPHAFPTRKFWMLYYFRRLGRWSSWRNTLAGQNGLGRRLRGGSRRRATGAVEDAALVSRSRGLDVRTREAAADMLRGLIDRGVHMCLVFSGAPRNYNYQRQFQDTFPDVALKGQVKVAYFKDADHTFSRMYMQDRLLDTLAGWARAVFSPDSPVQQTDSKEVATQGHLADTR